MSVQNQSKLPFVYGSVNKFNIPFLLDTGSNVSVISKQVADALKIKILPSPVACLSVTSQPLCIVGQAVVALRIAHFSWMHTVLVCDALSCPAILGADFVIKRKLLMDLANGYICFQFQSEYKIPIVFANNLKFHFFLNLRVKFLSNLMYLLAKRFLLPLLIYLLIERYFSGI